MNVHLCTTFGPPLDISLAERAFPVVIGRGNQTDVSVDDRWVSRVHCQLDAIDGRLFLRDLESKHGTYLNECRVDRAEILSGDRIEIGLTTILVETQDVHSSLENGDH